MEKRIRANKIENMPDRATPPTDIDPISGDQYTDYSHEKNHPIPIIHSESTLPPTEGEQSLSFGLGLAVCIVGLILSPIIIGIPILLVGLWMVLFPRSFANHAKKKK